MGFPKLTTLRLRRRRKRSSHELRSFRYDDVAAATSDFHPSTLLGRGSHASVFRAALEGGSLLAAAKVVTAPVSPGSSHRSAAYLSAVNEIEILSEVRSPFLVNLLGVIPDDVSHSARIAVVELMPNGSLYDHLHRCGGRLLTWHRRVRLALQVGEAIWALHSMSPAVIHRDIKSSNVLIDVRGNARVADFGFAVRLGTEGGSERPLPAGTIGYLDPNYVDPGGLSSKSDVFSFGVLLLEILTGRKAIDVDHSPPALLDWATPLVRLGELDALLDSRVSRPRGGSILEAVEEVASIAATCVAPSPEDRPEMADVVCSLRDAHRKASSSSRRLCSMRSLHVFFKASAWTCGRVSHVAA